MDTTRVHARRGLFGRWLRFTVLGEFFGFAIPGLTGAVLAATGAPDPVFAPLIILAGAGEGAVLGFAQAEALAPHLPHLDRWRWVRLTAAAAVLGWVIGMIPGTQHERISGLPAAVVIGAALILGLLFLVSIGGGQWLELRRHVTGAGWWVPANAVAWTLGVNAVIVAMAVVPNDGPAVAFALAALGGGLLMAATVAAVTGLTLVWLLRSQEGG